MYEEAQRCDCKVFFRSGRRRTKSEFGSWELQLFPKMCSTRFGLPFPRRKRIESRKRKCAVASLIASQSRIDLGTSWVCIYCALGRQCLCFFHALSLCKCMRACTGIKFMCLQCRFSANRYDQVESSSRIASDERRQRKGHVRDGWGKQNTPSNQKLNRGSSSA